MERFLFGEAPHTAGEHEFAGLKGAFQAGDELATEYATQYLYRQEEGVARSYPVLVIGREAAGRDHAMDMRMDLQILSPGVQHAEESDLGAEMFGIGGDLQQRRGAGTEQKVIDDFLVLQGEPREFVRKSKHDMHVLYGQQLFIAIGEPLIAGVGLAFGTVPRTT